MDGWIVVVDDDAMSLTNARIILGEQGLRISCLRSGRDLLKFMEKKSPDLILLDIMMPEMDGFETYQALRKFEEASGRTRTPVIFLTGDNDSETERRGLNAGASDFIRKPFDRDVLLTRIWNTIEHSRAIESLSEEASTDKLTGFLNKASGTERIGKLCGKKTGALMILDLDSFKLVNDLYGHDMGDQVLISFAESMRLITREQDTVSRIGGDEFLCFFEGMTDEDAVRALTVRLNKELTEKCTELMGDDFDIPIGISAGVVFAPESGDVFDELFQYADQSLYKVKQNGKHGYQIYTGDEEADAGETDLKSELARMTQIMGERGVADKAMILGQDTFFWCYRYIFRYAYRHKQDVTKMLFLLEVDEGRDLADAAEAFLQVLQNAIRRIDIILQSKANQFFLVLPDLSERDSGNVVARIIHKWESTDQHGGTHISCEVETVSYKDVDVPRKG